MVAAQPYARTLTAGDRKAIRNYSIDRLGSAVFQPWLRVYTAVHGGFREGWIPDDFYGFVALPVVNGRYRGVSDAKSLSGRILATDALPDLAYLVNGIWMDPGGEIIPPSRVKDRLAAMSPIVVVKPENSSQGRNVHCIPVADLDLPALERLGRLVVQRYVVQHDLMERLSPGCVATLRVTTGLTPEGVFMVLGAYLRMGHGGAAVVTSDEALKAVVSGEGELDRFAYAPDYTRLETHPDTGARFADLAIPGYAEAASLCVSLHLKVPQFAIIGWDVAIETDGSIAILEWNTDHPGIKFVEAVGGPHLGPLGLEAHAARRR